METQKKSIKQIKSEKDFKRKIVRDREREGRGRERGKLL